MSHLDEGTIHAWLDGALSADEAKSVEAHVHACQMCSAAVAEARGLVAASSRILGALDEVPGNVIPAGSRAAPVKKEKRMWRAAPWVTGIAAVLMAGVVLRTSDVSREATAPGPVAAPTAAVEEAAQAMPVDTVKPRAEIAASEPQRAVGPATASAPTAARSRPGSAVSGAGAASAERRVAAAPPSPSAPAAPPPSADARDMAAKSEAREFAAPVAMDDRRVLDAAAEFRHLSGCYTVSRAEGMSGGVAGAVTAQSEPRARLRQGMPSAAARDAGNLVLRVIRLDTLPGTSGYIVRTEPSDSAIGSWTPVGNDTARVSIGALMVLVSQANRVQCR